MADESRIVSRDGTKIGRQIVLPLSKAFEIAWKSIRIRMWRSLITMSGIVLAIAFLMSVLATGAVNSAFRQVPENDKNYALVQRALQQQAELRDDTTIRVGLVDAPLLLPGGQRAVPHENIRDSLQDKREYNTVLIPARQEALTRALTTQDEDEKLDAFVLTYLPEDLASAETLRLFGQFVERGGTLLVLGYDQILPQGTPAAVKQALDGLLPADPEGAETFQVKGSDIDPVRHSAVLQVRWNTQPALTYLAAKAVGEGQALVRAKGKGILWLGTKGKGEVFWYPVSGKYVADRTSLEWFMNERVVMGSLRWGAREKFASTSMAKRNLWLVCLSLLVCIVGITNSMLMSVTERFREIGTMKCLGALDKFVARLFLIESSLQGAAGSIVGVALGLALALIRALFAYHVQDLQTGEGHWLALHYFPWAQVLLWALVAIVVGVALSVVAAIVPAKRAAMMEPVVAMRVDA